MTLEIDLASDNDIDRNPLTLARSSIGGSYGSHRIDVLAYAKAILSSSIDSSCPSRSTCFDAGPTSRSPAKVAWSIRLRMIVKPPRVHIKLVT